MKGNFLLYREVGIRWVMEAEQAVVVVAN